jgi:hypothetical protein
MADTYYAYSRFDTDIDEWGRVKKSIMPGDKVTQSDLDVDDDGWAEYVDRGIVSTVPYPENAHPGESVNESFAREDAALAAGELDEDEAKKVKTRQKAQEGQVDTSTPVVEVHKADAKEQTKPS